MVCLAQTMYLSCIKISTISKRTKSIFHLSHITMEYLWVHPKWFLSLWYIWCKPCTYFAPTLTLSPYTLKRDSTWPKSPSSYIRWVQNDFWAYATFDANHAPILHHDYHCLQTEWNELPLEPHHLGVLSDASKIISKPVVHSTQNVHQSCVKISTISKRIESSFHLHWH
jgi:hypothetical protein